MAPAPDWRTDVHPDYRESPPWVMEDMIEREPELADDLDRLLGEVRPVAAAVSEALEAAKPLEVPVMVIGCGTAWHAALGIADVLGEALGRSPLVRGVQSFDALLDPPRSGLVIGVSDSGRTKATLSVLETAAANGLRTVSVSSSRSPRLAKVAELAIRTPVVDESWCHTMAFIAPIVAGAAIGAELSGEAIDVAALRGALAEGLTTKDQSMKIAKDLAGQGRILTIGSGADAAAAREMSLKLEEGAFVAATTHQIENVLHGHLVAVDDTTGLVVLATDRRGRDERAERAAAVLREARHVGVRTAAIVTPDVDAVLEPETTSAGRIVVADHTELPAALASYAGAAAAFQFISAALATCEGANPDFCRQDTPLYREAFQFGNAKIPQEAEATA